MIDTAEIGEYVVVSKLNVWVFVPDAAVIAVGGSTLPPLIEIDTDGVVPVPLMVEERSKISLFFWAAFLG